MTILDLPKTNLFEEVQDLIAKAFEEDRIFDDITTKICIPQEVFAEGEILLKEDACIAGVPFLSTIVQNFDEKLSVEPFVKDGQFCKKGTLLGKISGPAHLILSVERIVLNFLQHLCGVATYARKCVMQVSGLHVDVLDTRKTIPGLRHLQKYACRVAGVKNHRSSLEEQILIKNNHFTFMEKDAVSAMEKAWHLFPDKKIEVEVRTIEQLKGALELDIDAILLDNMSFDLLRECVKLVNGKVYLEASGNITFLNIRNFAETGVDGVSLGALTHSVQAVDISLRTDGV